MDKSKGYGLVLSDLDENRASHPRTSTIGRDYGATQVENNQAFLSNLI
ncbi:hypothetical protein [Lysinibacillus sp. GbtcB16]|nr:hypothetical protein [Lysinibacillus sp. GbtcB16]